MRESANEICFELNGKPYNPKDLHFSVSHGAAYAALVGNNESVGIDVAPMDGSSLSVAAAVFRPDEQAWMSEQPLIRFRVLWTLKERVTKATGRGFFMLPQSF